MAPRANWKGYLRLSLVSCPVALYPASSLSEKVSFNRINRKTPFWILLTVRREIIAQNLANA
jgi:non-homologous end joining protein Ku